MTKLVVRKIPWEFDGPTAPLMWQPANPDFGLFCTAFTFIAVPFERYIVSVVRRAADRLNQDPGRRRSGRLSAAGIRRGTDMTSFAGS